MEILPPEPQKVRVEYLDVTLQSGQTFSAALRQDRGDELTESPDNLTVRFGSGEVTVIARSAIALMTRRTAELTLPAPKFDPAKPTITTPAAR